MAAITVPVSVVRCRVAAVLHLTPAAVALSRSYSAWTSSLPGRQVSCQKSAHSQDLTDIALTLVLESLALHPLRLSPQDGLLSDPLLRSASTILACSLTATNAGVPHHNSSSTCSCSDTSSTSLSAGGRR